MSHDFIRKPPALAVGRFTVVKLDPNGSPVPLTEFPNSVCGIVYISTLKSLLVCDKINSTILMVDLKGSISRWLSRPDIIEPYGICTNKRADTVFIRTDIGDIVWEVQIPSLISGRVTGRRGSDFYRGLHEGSSCGSIQTNGTCCDSSNNVYLVSKAKHLVAVVRSSNTVEVAIGSGTRGCSMSVEATEMNLDSPCGVAYDFDGNGLILTDTGNSIIWLMKHDINRGFVPTIIGSPKSSRMSDGSFASSRFNAPTDVCCVAGKAFVIDDNGKAVRKIDLGLKTVSTIWRSEHPLRAISADNTENIFVTEE